MNKQTLSKGFRYDIAGLRAVAVIFVILNHTFSSFFASGYIGVDIFFVISGFVITKTISDNKFLNYKIFLLNFYSKRIKRIFPALVVLIFFTLLFASLFIADSGSYFVLAIRALIGISNINIYRGENDYFAESTSYNPLAQTWSLGVEEQFYFIFPLIIIFCGFLNNQIKNKKRLIYVLIILSVLSLVGYFYYLRIDIMASYFLMPFRFWQIASGAICYLLSKNDFAFLSKKLKYFQLIRFISLITLFTIINFGEGQLGLKAILTCLIINFLIINTNKKDLTYKILSNKFFLHIGKLSYSLYLWHWFVLSLSKYTIGDDIITIPIKLSLIYLISYFSWRFVELPFMKLNLSNFRTFLYGILVLGLSIISINLIAPFQNKIFLLKFLGIRENTKWLKEVECNGKIKNKIYKDPISYCLGGQRAKNNQRNIFLLGDSHAAQLYYMVEENINKVNESLKFINHQNNEDFPYTIWSSPKKDIYQTESINQLNKSIKEGDLIILTFHMGRLNNNILKKHIDLKKDPLISSELEDQLNHLKQFFDFTIGKKANLILIRDTPLLNDFFGSTSNCSMIKKIGLSRSFKKCRVSLEQNLHTRSKQDYLFDELRKYADNLRANLLIWDPIEFIPKNNGDFYFLNSDGSYIFDDQNHISRQMASKLSPKFREFLIENDLIPK